MRFLPTLLRLVTILMLMAGVTAFGIHVFPGEGETAIQVSAARTSGVDTGEGHGHSHEDWDGGGPAKHTHGHNPGDHSHDTLHSGVAIGAAAGQGGVSWLLRLSDAAAGRRLAPPDRPPRANAAV